MHERVNESACPIIFIFDIAEPSVLTYTCFENRFYHLMISNSHAYWTLFHSVSISNAMFLSSVYLFEALFFTQIIRINFFFETVPCKRRLTCKMYFLLIKRCLHISGLPWSFTAWKMSKYGVFSGPYFPVFSPNAGKYGPEKTPYLDTFHTVFDLLLIILKNF